MAGRRVDWDSYKQTREVFSTFLEQLKANTFVDNVMETFSDASQLPETIKTLQWICESACRPLQEWASDLPDIRKLVPVDVCNPDHCISVLGLDWDMESKSTFVRLVKLDMYASLEPTRRHILAAASSMFDADGRLTPTKIGLRLLLQGSWWMIRRLRTQRTVARQKEPCAS